MTDITAGQIWERQEQLEEEAAASLLGRMLFEFARLDVALGLCLVWIENGQKIEALTAQVQSLSFHKKLDLLKSNLEKSFSAGSKRHKAYDEWIEQAHVARLRRNELVHGRWGINPMQQKVVNVIGLPTSPEQREIEYSIEDLAEILLELQQLQLRLSKLRDQWPL